MVRWLNVVDLDGSSEDLKVFGRKGAWATQLLEYRGCGSATETVGSSGREPELPVPPCQTIVILNSKFLTSYEEARVLRW